jgi:hypothetical protein
MVGLLRNACEEVDKMVRLRCSLNHKIVGTVTPIYLSYLRELTPNTPGSPIDKIRRIFREVLILYPALFFMLNYTFIVYTLIFFLLLVALNAIYEIGYIYNDYVRIRYDEKPRKRVYINLIHPRLAVALRIVYLITVGVALNFLVVSYILALALLVIAILNHNFRTRKIDKVTSLPLLRVAKYMFIPIAFSNLSLEEIAASLILILPLLILESETIAWDIINHYEPLKTSLRKPYYAWFLTFLPFQLLLLKYPPWIFTGEFLFIIMSGVRHI